VGASSCTAGSTRTFVTTFIFFPWLYWDFATAVSSRLMTLSSSFYTPVVSPRNRRPCPPAVEADSSHLTAALDIINSISPRCALMSFSKFSQTFSSIPNRLFSAKVCRKFFTVPPLSAPPVCFSSSATIWDLSASVRVGARRMIGSLGSDFRIWLRELSALETESRALVFAAAVYWSRRR
jgi:hypothetical protein